MSHCAIKIISSRLGGRDSTPRHSVLSLLMAMIQVVVLVVASADRIGTSLCISKGEGREVRHC